MRRSYRARQAARAATLTRLAWGSAIITALLLLSVMTASIGAAASYYQSEQSDINGLSRSISSRDSVRIYDSKGVLLYQFSDNGAQHSISLAQVPITAVNATVAIEDRSFWVNQGVDFTSIIRAAQANLSQGYISQGGSTITQQLIKQNILSSNETFDRKLREAIIAVGMTTTGTYTKRQILEMYLNSIGYGQEAYGIDAAATAYFGYQDDPATGKSAAQQLDLAQASMLAGIPQNPNTNNPLLNPERARARQTLVLQAMVDVGYITPAERDAALKESAKPGFLRPAPFSKNRAPHFVNFVRDQLTSMLQTGQLKLTRSGLNVYTTLDIGLQDQVQQYMKDHLYGDDRDSYGNLIRSDNVTNSAALLVNHSNGDIKVMLGSVDYYSTKIPNGGTFNVVTDGYRSPGSSFKPIVYGTAFEKGWAPAMTVADMPTVFWDEGQNKPYKPLNFNYQDFWGTITLRTALQNSLNIPAVKVMQFAGIDDARKNAMRMGISQWKGTWGLSSVLGSLDTTMYQMVQAYTVFANYGQYIPLHAINQITDGTGSTIYQYRVPRGIQVLSPQVAFLITSVLSDNKARAKDFGICSPLYLYENLNDCYIWRDRQQAGTAGNYATWPSPNAWPAASKTGTAQDFRDDWALGYTMDYTMGVWVGNNNSTPMLRPNGTGIDGVTGAAPIWHNSMVYAEKGLAKRPFPVPSGVYRAPYTSNGVTTTDWFIKGMPLPANTGNGGDKLPCIKFNNDPNNPWDYSDSKCQGRLIPGGPNVYR